MDIIKGIREMHSWSRSRASSGFRIALVPTMGFLHEGHLSLVREARKQGDRIVVSIFANPTQFGPGEDFENYPRDLERDCRLLEKEQVDLVFNPDAADIYPGGYRTYVDVEQITAPLCGGRRPGHFRGVATVVLKLFNIVAPDVAVFGLKDYQQVRVITRMVADLNLGVKIVACPIIREPDGLALSSRNRYLTGEERAAAAILHRALERAEELAASGERSAEKIRTEVLGLIETEPLVGLEYADLCDPDELTPVQEINGQVLLAVCAWVGKARLIDNTVIVVSG